MYCPNCSSLMNEGDPCPECDHVEGDDFCECSTCSASRGTPHTKHRYPDIEDDDDFDYYDQAESDNRP